jgi:hypothetical protein
VCLPLSLLLLLPVPGLLLLAAVTGLSAHGPVGMGAAVLMLWALWRGGIRSVRAAHSWWIRAGVSAPPGRVPR